MSDFGASIMAAAISDDTSSGLKSVSFGRMMASGVLSDPVRVAISSIKLKQTARLVGENTDHVQMLAELDVTLPPIIVHRSSMTVIDGAHRLRAATLRGEDVIEVVFFDGDERDAFVLGVEANTVHGLPLTLADRTAAAERILGSHPHWSDRAVAACTGLSPKTVARIRKRASEEIPQLTGRVGRDGKIRPTNVSAGRRAAGRLIADNPDASLRQIADAAGVSTGTVRDVRERLRRGEDPVPSTRRRPPGARPSAGVDLIESLQKDPALRFSDHGRLLLRLFDTHLMDENKQDRLIDSVPAHRLDAVASLAEQCAESWSRIASLSARRAKDC
ncbi:ParB/RepB/Spo0J family partition protein [Nocardia gipuzkoensis]